MVLFAVLFVLKQTKRQRSIIIVSSNWNRISRNLTIAVDSLVVVFTSKVQAVCSRTRTEACPSAPPAKVVECWHQITVHGRTPFVVVYHARFVASTVDIDP